MERRDREAAAKDCPAGWRQAVCQVCGAALYVQAGDAGPAVCAGHRTPPDAGAIDPAALYAETARIFTDSQLITAVELADAAPERLGMDKRRIGLWLGAMTAEVLRRLDSRKAA
jgi:hypothetical protein